MPEFSRINDRILHHHMRAGDGRAVVFANSLGTDLRIWDGVIARLPATTPILTYDKSGHGLSEIGATSIDDLSADLAGLMDLHGINDALICGVSVGGLIAQALAHVRPDLVAGLLLSNTSQRIGTDAVWNDRIAALDAHGLEPMGDPVMERWFSPAFHHENAEQLQGYRMMLTRTPAAGYRAVCVAIRDADLTETTRMLTVPTVCLAGGDDKATPPDTVKDMAKLIAGARYECLDGIGHLPCVEAPDAVADLLRDQLQALA